MICRGETRMPNQTKGVAYSSGGGGGNSSEKGNMAQIISK